MIARPIAASAAATVKINIVKIWPTMSPEKIENDINQKLKEVGKAEAPTQAFDDLEK